MKNFVVFCMTTNVFLIFCMAIKANLFCNFCYSFYFYCEWICFFDRLKNENCYKPNWYVNSKPLKVHSHAKLNFVCCANHKAEKNFRSIFPEKHTLLTCYVSWFFTTLYR